VYSDIRKAFDSIDLIILLKKLEYSDISGPMSEWFRSYLNDRSQQIKIGNTISTSFKVLSGVPQGGQ